MIEVSQRPSFETFCGGWWLLFSTVTSSSLPFRQVEPADGPCSFRILHDAGCADEMLLKRRVRVDF